VIARREIFRWAGRTVAAVCAAALPLAAAAASAPAEFEPGLVEGALPQNDPVSRARAFAKAGGSQIHEAREAVKNGDYEKAEKILTDYRDTVKQLHQDLRATVPNPEKKPNGFKQLQIHVRKTLKEIDDIVVAVPANLKPPFEFLRREIDQLDRAMIEDLFPRRPGREEKKGAL